jgi:hypothetical protein
VQHRQGRRRPQRRCDNGVAPQLTSNFADRNSTSELHNYRELDMGPGEAQTTSEPRLERMPSYATGNSDVTCRALHVALCVVQLQIAWHSGVISGDAAMAALQQEIARPSVESLYGSGGVGW